MTILGMRALFLICLFSLLGIQARPLLGNFHVSTPNYASSNLKSITKQPETTMAYHCLCAATALYKLELARQIL